MQICFIQIPQLNVKKKYVFKRELCRTTKMKDV